MVLPGLSLYQTSLLKGSTTPFNARTAAILDHATFTLAFLPLVSTLQTQMLQVCTLLCWLLCQLPSTSQPSSLMLTRISGPRFHFCAPGLSSRPIQYPRIKGLIFKGLYREWILPPSSETPSAPASTTSSYLPSRNHPHSQLHSTSLLRSLCFIVSLNFHFISAHLPIRVSQKRNTHRFPVFLPSA